MIFFNRTDENKLSLVLHLIFDKQQIDLHPDEIGESSAYFVFNRSWPFLIIVLKEGAKRK